MYCHYPKQIPDSEVYYEIIPGQGGTWDQPEYAPEIEFGDIEINGQVVSIELHELLMREYGGDWEYEIINQLKARRVTV